METTDIKKAPQKVFPLTDVRDCLLAELTALAISEAAMSGISVPKAGPGLQTVAIALDSLSVVDVICAVEPILGFSLKDSIVKTGGYKSIDEAMGHVMPRIQASWSKINGVVA